MFKGLGDLANLSGMLKQAMDVKAKIEQIKEDMAKERVEASAGGGMVAVKMNGQKNLVAVRIEREVFASGDLEMLQDLIQAAVNEAARRVDEQMASRVGNLAGGLNIPGLT